MTSPTDSNGSALISINLTPFTIITLISALLYLMMQLYVQRKLRLLHQRSPTLDTKKLFVMSGKVVQCHCALALCHVLLCYCAIVLLCYCAVVLLCYCAIVLLFSPPSPPLTPPQSGSPASSASCPSWASLPSPSPPSK